MTPRASIGILADTHGLLRPTVFDALAGVDIIVHAGDVGADEIIDQLAAVAPVVAVRGNTDWRGAAGSLPATEVVEVAGCLVLVIHILDDLDIDPKAAGISMVVSGHTHRPEIVERHGIVFVNPGSAGPVRPGHPPASVARADIANGRPSARIVTLK